jgi:hypothetical protein
MKLFGPIEPGRVVDDMHFKPGRLGKQFNFNRQFTVLSFGVQDRIITGFNQRQFASGKVIRMNMLDSKEFHC